MVSNYFENKWKRKGFRVVCGIDEAGRGPFAGPLVAACVVMQKQTGLIKAKITDSKALTEPERERAFEQIIAHCLVGVGIVSNKLIDRHGLGRALRLVYKKALKSLGVAADVLLLDGKVFYNLGIPGEAIVKGDGRVRCIAAASIVAKVTRDRIMVKYAKKYPDYAFEQHKGYGTRLHRELIKRHGTTEIHRKSFAPIKEAIGQKTA